MTGFAAINLAKLPPPDVVEALDAEKILADLLADLQVRYADFDANVESDPVIKLAEAAAYRETVLRARINDAARATMLAYAVGADLDNLAALFGVVRLIIAPADAAAVPPVAAVLEDDARLRRRAQLALEGFSTAGPVGAYIFHGLSASADVVDLSVQSLVPGEVLITILAAGGVPADQALQDLVWAALNVEEVRPLSDLVTVQPAALTAYAVEAELTLYSGPDGETVRQAAEDAVAVYVADNYRLGRDITQSGLLAALHQPGVQNVTLITPAADIVIGPAGAAHCTGITVTIGGYDD